MKYIIVFIAGVILTVFSFKLIQTEQKINNNIQNLYKIACRNSEALFNDHPEDYNEYAISLVDDLHELRKEVWTLEDRIEKLEQEKK